jgi:hypothetical protein
MAPGLRGGQAHPISLARMARSASAIPSKNSAADPNTDFHLPAGAAHVHVARGAARLRARRTERQARQRPRGRALPPRDPAPWLLISRVRIHRFTIGLPDSSLRYFDTQTLRSWIARAGMEGKPTWVQQLFEHRLPGPETAVSCCQAPRAPIQRRHANPICYGRHEGRLTAPRRPGR